MEETYYTSPSEWKKDLTYNVYMPIACEDVLALQRFDLLLKRHKINGFSTKRDAPVQLFFGNHPIKWVCVVGRVVSVEYREHHAMCVFRLSDGLGPTALMCVQKSVEFAAAQKMKAGQIVVVYGEVRPFGGETQVVARVLHAFPNSDSLRYYVLRELSVQVRKHILERSAEEFKLAIRPIAIPKLTVLNLEIAEVAGLLNAAHKKCLQWGLRFDQVISDPIWSYPEPITK